MKQRKLKEKKRPKCFEYGPWNTLYGAQLHLEKNKY